MWNDFKTFALRGNVIDLAVGVIVGAAFTGIVNSLVTDLLMPPLGFALGGIDFSDFFFVLKGEHAETLEAARKAGAVTVNYGVFINAVIRFMIVAFAIFMLVRWINRLFAATKAAAAGPTKTETLLEEIRDELKARPQA
ncbi:MAG TPA: large conductance mechanosensitive channel protein MscL [Alphaproteobacteria bacterium]|jgi:large conductance mechanosensitive channel|nr:large conductance mechanosensitive channel protein MscL [Alphaproteobacteria bacterium]